MLMFVLGFENNGRNGSVGDDIELKLFWLLILELNKQI